MSIMVLIPTADKGIDDNEAPLVAIRKFNAMISALLNKIPPISLGPWLVSEKVKKADLLQELPEDFNIVERYIYDFNRFISPGDRA